MIQWASLPGLEQQVGQAGPDARLRGQRQDQRAGPALRGSGEASESRRWPLRTAIAVEPWALGPSLLQGHECGSVSHGEEEEGVYGAEAQMAAALGPF